MEMGGAMNIVYAGISENINAELALLRSTVAAVTAGDVRGTIWLPGTSAEAAEKIMVLPGESVVFGGASLDIRRIEAALDWLVALWLEQKPDLVLLPGSSLGHELAVRCGRRLTISCLPEIRSLSRTSAGFWGRKKVCGSNLDWECAIELPAILTISRRKAAFSGAWAKPGAIENRPLSLSALPRWLLSYETLEPCAANPLENAGLIFAGGRGLGSAALAERLRRLASRYGAAPGLSRPAALNGWGKIGDIIGQSGIRTSAKCCLAIGISGAAAFMAGIESAEYLIAVNTDPHAPIFQYADTGIIAGAEEFIAAMETAADQKPPPEGCANGN